MTKQDELLTPRQRARIRTNWLKGDAQIYDILIENTAKAQLAKCHRDRPELREKMVQGVNMILLHNLVRPRCKTAYTDPEELNAYQEWLGKEVDNQIIPLIEPVYKDEK